MVTVASMHAAAHQGHDDNEELRAMIRDGLEDEATEYI